MTQSTQNRLAAAIIPFLQRVDGGVQRIRVGSVTAICFVLTAVFNYQFVQHRGLIEILHMNDVWEIMAGYHRTGTLPHAFVTFLSKPWIQASVLCFRPVSGCQYWIETWIGLHFGFIYDAFLAYFLTVGCAVMIALLAYRLTGSKWCMLLSAVLGCVYRFYNASHPDYWLIWYPVHQDILMMDFLFGAALAFDTWFEKRTRAPLAAAWICFVLGCLTKEYDYILPAFFTVICLFRPAPNMRARLTGLVQAGISYAVVFALMAYRKYLFVHPRDPHWMNIYVLERKPPLFMYNAIGRNMIAHNYWFVGFAALLVAMLGFPFLARYRGIKLGVFAKLYVWLPMVVGIISVYFWITVGSPAIGFWYVCDTDPDKRIDLITIMCLMYTMILIVKYRRLPGTITAYLFVALSYMPVISYTGWHYALPGAMVRAVYWGVMLQLVWIDTAGIRKDVVEKLFGRADIFEIMPATLPEPEAAVA